MQCIYDCPASLVQAQYQLRQRKWCINKHCYGITFGVHVFLNPITPQRSIFEIGNTSTCIHLMFCRLEGLHTDVGCVHPEFAQCLPCAHSYPSPLGPLRASVKIDNSFARNRFKKILASRVSVSTSVIGSTDHKIISIDYRRSTIDRNYP